MNKISKYLLIAANCLLFACNNNLKEASATSSEPLVEYSLRKHGVPCTISLPKSKMQLLIDSMQVYGDLTIDMGKTFNLIISPANQTIEEIKKDISANDVNKFKKYIIDEANTLLYETEIVNPEYHFRYFVSIGKEQMMIADGLNADGTTYTEAEIKLMLECAQTIKAN
jgi:hypothetical protein